VTGAYRNNLYGGTKITALEWVMYAAIFVLIAREISVFAGGFTVFSVWVAIQYYLDDLTSMFDGEILDIDGIKMGVAIPTQKEEGELESLNFVATNDRRKLITKLNDSKLVYSEDKVVTWSIGSTTSQCIYGQTMTPFNEYEMGVDRFSDEDIEKFLDAHDKIIGHDGVLAFMNSIGYGVEEGGIVYSDNTMEHETILKSIVPRQIGATGNNENAMRLVERFAKIHMRNKYDYTLAIVPRGDKTMPQGGSHSKQRVLEHFLDDDEDIIIIEVSGKQTKKFELPAGTGVSVIESSEKICKFIKETKIVDENGKTHGSQMVFGQWV